MGRIILVLIFISCCAIQPCFGTGINYVDTTTCTVKKFDTKQIASHKSDPDFNYENTGTQGGGLLSLIGSIISDFLERISQMHVGRISLYNMLLYGLMLFAAVMIVLQFFKIKITGLFAGQSTGVINHQSYSENVHELNFDTLIKEACAAQNFRLATRLYYLKVLKRLSDTGLIKWQTNKTNFEYYYELKGEERRKQFYDITHIFESVWYGNLEISETTFDENLKIFTGFLQTLKS